MRPARKPVKPTTARIFHTVTSRLYACGHEHTASTPPAEACPTCGVERDARYPDVRQRVPITT